MDRLGLDTQTGFGMPPDQFIELTAALGCSHLTLGLTPAPWNPCQWPDWSLRDDRQLQRRVQALLREHDIVVTQGEGFAIRPEVDMRDKISDLDLMAALGARNIGSVSLEPDHGRALTQLALLAELAGARGMGVNFEFAPPHPVGSLPGALAMIDAVGAGNLRLTLDAMHVFRSGATLDELAALPAAVIGHVQLCDVPRRPPHPDYMQEACFERLPPLEGELPLREFLQALPPTIPLGLEVPMQRAATVQQLPDAIAAAVRQARALLQTL